MEDEKKDSVFGIIDWIALILAIVIAASIFCSCSTQKQVVGHTDSIYVDKIVHDSVYINQVWIDSIYQHDSVFITKDGETTYVDRWHDKYIYQLRHDTVWKYYTKADSVAEIKADTIMVEKEKELSKWQTFKIETGEFFLTICFGFILYWAVKIFKNKNS